jgi:hypothetical protein
MGVYDKTVTTRRPDGTWTASRMYFEQEVCRGHGNSRKEAVSDMMGKMIASGVSQEFSRIVKKILDRKT